MPEYIEEMYGEVLKFVQSIQNEYLKKVLQAFFVEDEEFIGLFKKASAAKSVHHGFIGGLLEHTLSVTKLCDYYCTAYPMLKRDLLLTAAMCHDIGKVKELSAFPINDYTDELAELSEEISATEEALAELSAQIVELDRLDYALDGKYYDTGEMVFESR